jgi:hypothetical protein
VDNLLLLEELSPTYCTVYRVPLLGMMKNFFFVLNRYS